MFEEQLAAIAAAMSVLQHSLQSNSPIINHHHQQHNHQPQQQQPQHQQQQHEHLQHLHHQQQQQFLFDHYQPQLLQSDSTIAPPRPAEQQLQQPQVLTNNNKPSRPQSYSAIVGYPRLFHSQNVNQQQPMHQQQQQQHYNNHQPSSHINNCLSHNTPSPGSATNLLGFMGLYVGNLSPDLTKEQLEKIFAKYGEPVKAHRLIRSPVAFIKYENTESPRAAIDDLHGLLLPELTLNQDQPLKLHFDRNDAQLKANYRPKELPAKSDNGECYGWRTTVCRRGKNCPKKHIPINRGIDFQMWMIKSTPTTNT